MGRLVIISGPSCIGKSPLARVLRKLYPELMQSLEEPVLYNSREPRPGEIDGITYHFRSRGELEAMRGASGTVVLDVRKDVQALVLADVRAIFEAGKDALFEGNPYVASALMASPELAGIELVTVFLSPLSAEELSYLAAEAPRSVERLVTDVMRRKLLRRTQRQKGILSLRDLDDIEARCGAAYRELGYAHQFQHVIPNHDGEDSEHWEAFYYPVGDARKCVLDVAAVLRGAPTTWAERWDADVVPQAGG